MTRRLIAAIVAVLCTLLGAVLLTGYVTGADKRAMANLDATDVLVVAQPIAAGTAADALGSAVEVKTMPRTAVVAGSIVTVSEIAGKVAAVDLQPGEQVLVSRFIDPPDPNEARVVPLPAGRQAVSVVLDAERVQGGILNPGDTVGVFVSTNQGDDTGVTKLVINSALVLNVQGGVPAGVTAGTTTSGTTVLGSGGNASPSAQASAVQAPQVKVMVTLALSAPDAERLVWGAEHGGVWLSLQNDKTSLSGSRLTDNENVYK